MTRALCLILALSWPISGVAETLVAAHTIRSQTILQESDVTTIMDKVPGALTHPLDAVGMEARVVLYAGRPIRRGDLIPPALVHRNGLVTLIYEQGGLAIATEGRALDRGAEGDRIMVMNLASRSRVSGTVDAHGRVRVGPSKKLLSDLELE